MGTWTEKTLRLSTGSDCEASPSCVPVQVSRLLTSPLKRAQDTAQLVATYQQLSGSRKPEVETLAQLTNRDWGKWEGRSATEVRVAQRLQLYALQSCGSNALLQHLLGSGAK